MLDFIKPPLSSRSENDQYIGCHDRFDVIQFDFLVHTANGREETGFSMKRLLEMDLKGNIEIPRETTEMDPAVWNLRYNTAFRASLNSLYKTHITSSEMKQRCEPYKWSLS